MDFYERLLLMDLKDRKLATLLSIESGVGQTLTMDERDQGECPLRPDGWIRSMFVDTDTVVVQTFTPEDETAASGDGVVRKLTWSFDKARFEPLDEPVTRPYDARRCR